MGLSVVIPAYNEQKRIVETLRETIDFLTSKKIDYEILVVDDGSSDQTRGQVKSFFNQSVTLTPVRPNRGKGFSVREGMLKSKKECVVFMDADNSTSIREIERFLPCLNNYDVVIGSRNLPDSIISVSQPRLRSALGKMFPFLVRALVVRGIKDTQCGFKLFSRRALEEVFPRSRLNRWGFDVEILFISKRRGLKIKELAVTWKNEGQSKLRPFSDAIDMFGDLIRIRYNSLRGLYK